MNARKDCRLSEMALDVRGALERIGDMELYREIAFYFAGHLDESVKDLRQALERGDLPQAMRYAHSMKGNCAMVGAELPRAESYTLENLCRSGNLEEARSQLLLLLPLLEGMKRQLLDL